MSDTTPVEVEMHRTEHKVLRITLAEIPKWLRRGWQVEAINDVFLVAFCEGCLKPIMEGDQYEYTADDCHLCPACAASATESAEEPHDA